MAPEGPEDPKNQVNPPDQETLRREMRCYIPANLPKEVLERIFAANLQSFRVSSFINGRVCAVISPEILGGRFNKQEALNWGSPRSPSSCYAAFWDAADLSDALYCHVPYFETNPTIPQNGRPFNLTMSVSHIISNEGGDGTVVEASPSNLVKAHENAFAGGHLSGEICGFIEAGNADTELPVTALVMEIPGEFPDNWIQEINHFADGNNMLGYRHVARFKRPDLATALQSAISRVKTPGVINTADEFNSSSVVTNEKGPGGKPIVVSCYPSWNRIILAEDNGNLGNSPMPTRTILVRPIFATPSSEDAENLT